MPLLGFDWTCVDVHHKRVNAQSQWRPRWLLAQMQYCLQRAYCRSCIEIFTCAFAVFFNRGSAETDRNRLVRNSQPQFCAVVAIQTLGSLHRVPWATLNICGRLRCSKKVEKHCNKVSPANGGFDLKQKLGTSLKKLSLSIQWKQTFCLPA